MRFRNTAIPAVLAGAVAALGHAPFDLWYLALLGFLGLFWLVAHRARPAWCGWFGGLGYFGVSMHWIVEPFLVDVATHGWMAPFALVLLAGGLGLFWALAAWLAGKISATAHHRAIPFAIFLMAAEMLRGHIFTGFPWALPAYIWADTPVRVSAAYFGSYGLSLLTLTAVAIPVAFGWRAGMPAAIVAIGTLFFLGTLPAKNHPAVEHLGTVRVVQPNVPQSEKWVAEKVPAHLDRLFDLTEGQSVDQPETPELVVWPEVAVVYPLDRAGAVIQRAVDALRKGSTEDGALIFGVNRRDQDNNWYNSLVVMGRDGEISDTYDKVHLVPFGEYIPFKLKFIQAMAATSGFGFSAGAEVRLIETPLGRAVPLICYEGIFPGHLFKPAERADYILQITNDAWFGTFSGPFQHFDQARFRAAEQGLPLVRVANTGVSAVIGPFGEIGESIPLGVSGVSDQPVVVAPGYETFYSKTGDLPVVLILLLTSGVLMMFKLRNTIANRRTTS